MKQFTSQKDRKRFSERHQAGQTYAAIAAEFGVSPGCVRLWCRRQRDGGGVQDRYYNPRAGVLSQFSAELRERIYQIRQAHPHLGPASLWVQLGKETAFRGQALPSRASLGRYVAQFPEFRPPPPKKPHTPRPRPPERVHQRWLIDFKVDLQLQDGQWVHLHTVRDPVGAAFIGAELYPAAHPKSRVTRQQVQRTLRHCFGEHGLPEEIQTDWEPALNAATGEAYPSLFTLWLVGLGIGHVHARPRIPTDDAEVERAHRTLAEYSLLDALDQPLETLRQQLAQAVRELNHTYPSRARGCQGQPPVVAHPELLRIPRPFDPRYELAQFDLSRVDAFLASFQFERKVEKTGQVGVGGDACRYSLGRKYAGQQVQLHFDPHDRCMVACQDGGELRRWPAKQVSVEDIVGFSAETACPCPQQLALPHFWEGVSPHELPEV